MYKDSNDEKSFFELKPELNEKQQMLLSSFYRLSQERLLESGAPLPIKNKDIYFYIQHYGCSFYPVDLFVEAIHSIDRYYIDRRCEEITKETRKHKV